MRLPSSHVSPQPAGAVTPSPQVRPTSTVQWALHPSQLAVLPSSHASPPSTTPSPHRGRVQSVRQASGVASLLAAPSSQRSQVDTKTPSPQTALPGSQSDTTFPVGKPKVLTHAVTNVPSGIRLIRTRPSGIEFESVTIEPSGVPSAANARARTPSGALLSLRPQ